MEKVHFETLGCKLNQIETESLAQAFSEAGFSIDIGRESGNEGTPKPKNDLSSVPLTLSVVNTCTVTGKAEQKARRLIRLLLKNHPETPVLVTGCYAEVERHALAAIDPHICVFPGSRKDELADLPRFISLQSIMHPEASILSVLSAFCETKPLENQSLTDKPSTDKPDTFRLATDNFRFHSRASIKIQDGCNNRCSYCRIVLARGKSVSLEADEVIARIKKIEDAGWAEVILAGVNLSQYRSEHGDFADLLRRILGETNSIAIRVSSLHPERIDDAILPLLKSERVRPHFHLSVQSGSDVILASMRRPYTAETVYLAAKRLRSIKENPFIACDIITGFPGETDECFDSTLAMCQDIGFAWIHAFPFSPRPGTAAWSMVPRIPERVAGERLALLSALAKKNHEAYEASWTGRELMAIVEGGDPEKPVTVLTSNYLSVKLDNPEKKRILRGTELKIRYLGDGHAQFVN